jgi:hypothetical protein
MKILKLLRKTEIYFILALFILNVYCAFALKGESVVNSTHLMMACVMLMFANDKILAKIEKK